MKTPKRSDFISPALFTVLSKLQTLSGKLFQQGVSHGVGQGEIRMRSPYTGESVIFCPIWLQLLGRLRSTKIYSEQRLAARTFRL